MKGDEMQFVVQDLLGLMCRQHLCNAKYKCLPML